jgi:hypothetical protein
MPLPSRKWLAAPKNKSSRRHPNPTNLTTTSKKMKALLPVFATTSNIGLLLLLLLLLGPNSSVHGQQQTTTTMTTTNRCSQHRDCYFSHGFGAICSPQSGTCSSVGPPLVNPRPPDSTNTAAFGGGASSSNGAGTINCSTCPGGYFDGCNICSCIAGQAVCTRNTCGTYVAASSCRNPGQPRTSLAINCRTCPNGYYDGCNTCSCRGGTSTTTAVCTLRACSTYGTASCNNNNLRPTNPPPPPSPPTTPASSTLVPPPPPSPWISPPRPAWISCSLCPNGYYDGCNTCSCRSGAGRAPVCTTRTCARYDGTAACTNIRPNPTPTPPPRSSRVVSCRTCPHGYYDGCNVCSCQNNNDGNGANVAAAACTLRYCSTLDTPRCNNNKPPSTTTTTDPIIGATGDATTQPRQDESSIVDCRTCPNGYFDGCNNCRCGGGTAGGDGANNSLSAIGACTRMGCRNGNTAPPKCN